MTPQEQEETGRPKNKLAWVWIILAVLLAAVSVIALWWWKASNPIPAATCDPKKMSLSTGQTEHVNDIAYIHIVATNNGKTPCTLEGYPTVSALDSKGENFVASVAQTNPYYPSSVVTLAPRGQAYVAVGVPNADLFDEAVCTKPTATLRMYLPAPVVAPGVTPLVMDFSQKICPGFSVTVFRPGA